MAADRPVLVVVGAGGQVGRSLVEAGPPPGWDLRPLAHCDIDITSAASVSAALNPVSRGMVVNAAAFTAVDRAEGEEALAFAVNAKGAGLLAAAAAARGLGLIHLSTDYVFDGQSRQPYDEAAPTGPLSAYGRSKLAGEERVLRAHPCAVILRTAWVFSAFGGNFVRTILRLAAERPELRVVADQYGCPTATAVLAEAIRVLAPRLLSATAGSAEVGVFHLCSDEAVSWHGFAAAILGGLARRGRPVPPLVAITTDAFPLPARRPAYSVLDCRRLTTIHGIRPSPWRPELEICLDHLLEGA